MSRFLLEYAVFSVLVAFGYSVYHWNFGDFLPILYCFGFLFMVGAMGTLAKPSYDNKD